MDRAELKTWAKEKIKGHIWELFIPILVAGILTGLTVGTKIQQTEHGFKVVDSGYNLGIFFAFVEVGLIIYLVKFIKDQPHEFKEIFAPVNDYIRIFITSLHEALMIFVFLFLLIVPGIMKAYSYALVTMLLGDEKYKDLKSGELLALSEKMMAGHRMDLFVLQISFIGWYLLAPFTLGLLLIWLEPYSKVAQTKFLLDIKEKYEAENK